MTISGPDGYIYDPEVGDPDGGIAPGTPFEKIPDEWVCPVCGATKDFYNAIPEQETVVKKHVPFNEMPELDVETAPPPSTSGS